MRAIIQSQRKILSAFAIEFDNLSPNEEDKFSLRQVGATFEWIAQILSCDKDLSQNNVEFYEQLGKMFETQALDIPYPRALYQHYQQEIERFPPSGHVFKVSEETFELPNSSVEALCRLPQGIDRPLSQMFSKFLRPTFYKLCYFAAYSNENRAKNVFEIMHEIRDSTRIERDVCLAISRGIQCKIWGEPDRLSFNEKEAVFGLALKLILADNKIDQSENVALARVLKFIGVESFATMKEKKIPLAKADLVELVQMVDRGHYRHVLSFLLELCLADTTFCEDERALLLQISKSMKISSKVLAEVLRRGELDTGQRIHLSAG
jgi:uncharacterized tellurite resistance protein B-like protein